MNNKKDRKPNYIFRVVAGGYLVYLAYQLVTDPLFKTMTGWKYAVNLIGAIAFVGFGLWFVIYGIKGLYLQYKGAYDDSPELTEEDDAEAGDEEPENPESEESDRDNNIK